MLAPEWLTRRYSGSSVGYPYKSIPSISYNSSSNRIDSISFQNGPVSPVTKYMDYDANGNTIQNEVNGLDNATFESRNLFTWMVANSSAVLYNYDADGNRMMKHVVDGTKTHYIRGADGQTIAVYENGSLLFTNILSPSGMVGTFDGTERRYFLKDHLGSVRTTVDESGNVDGYDDYYAFGLVMPGRSSNSANPNDQYKFTGHELDDEAGIDLYHANARGYDPTIARFMQVDPLYDQFPSWSTYTYGLNNPMKYIDPTGMAAEDAGGCPPCGFEYFTRWLFQDYDNTYVGDLFRADAQGDGKLEQKVAEDAEAAGNAIVDATAELADDVSDASTIVAAGGIVAAPFTGGSSLTVTGYALGVGTAADATSTVAKGVDAMAFDGSSQVALNQLGETAVNVLGGRYLP